MSKTLFFAGCLAVLAGSVAQGEVKSLAELPVAACADKAYLSDMDGRPWWNKAWKKRAAILVSNMSKVRTRKTTIDFVFDVGEKIDPASVRVVTPWETVVDCVAERVEVSSCSGRKDDSNLQLQSSTSTAVRLLFQTDLREMENRPFFVYWDNPEAKAPAVFSTLAMSVDADEVRVNNGCVDVTFDNRHCTAGLIRRLSANASPAAESLMQRTTEYAWEGFVFETEKSNQPKPDSDRVRPGNELDREIHKPDSEDCWSPAQVTADNALCKTITFTNAFASVAFTLYAGESRVNYAYRLAPGLKMAKIGVSWLCGGGTAQDDVYYVGQTGKVLTQRAALDWVTDCEPNPLEYYNFPWIGGGWYAFVDRETRDVVGMVFDRESYGSATLRGAQDCGEQTRLIFRHNSKAGECATGSGALVATVGDYKAVADTAELLQNRPRVFVASVQPYREIPLKKPDLAHDFCANFCVGGWRSTRAFPNSDWDANIVTHLRSRGANVLNIAILCGDYTWKDVPVSQDLYDRIAAYASSINPKWKAPGREGSFTGERLRQLCAAAHAKGMAVSSWLGTLGHAVWVDQTHQFDPKAWELDQEMQLLFAQCGVDSVFNNMGGGESQPFPKDIEQKLGRQFWKWDDPSIYFDLRKKIGAFNRQFYDYAHQRKPDTRVMVFNSDNGALEREGCMPYYTGAVDTLFCEFVQNGDFDYIKHIAKRLRSYFDNEAARTIFAHSYSMKLDYSERISQFEQPFICGINGFSMENLTYETSYLENSQFQADFYRLASYTRLGEKAAKMAPVKNLAVYRDMNCFEEDCRKHRTSTGGYGYAMTRQDKLANAFARIPSCSYDLVMTPFFKLDSLKRYKVIYIPDDDVLSDEDVATALAFVKQGGGLVLEGASGEKVMEKVKVKGEGEQRNRSSSENGESSAVHLGPSPSPLVPATPTQYGKGKIVWTKDVLTEKVWLNGRKECVESKQKILSLVASVGGEEPLKIDNPSLDGILQSSASGMFLGVFNRGKQKEVGKVSLDSNNQTIKQSNNLFVLDVRTGFRIPYTNGFEIAIGPKQCGFYLIGDDAFTAVPETKEAVWYGASAVSTHAHGNRRTAKVDPDFKVRSCVEFVTPAPRNYKGLPSLIERSEKAMLNRYRFCAPEAEMVKKAGKDDLEAWMKACADGVRYYSPAAFSRALAEASYLHVQCDTADCDAVFADCKEALKALLKRGGGILFSRTKPGPNACKFLEEVGVSNPWPSTKGGFPAPAMWSPNVSTNHPFHAAQGSLFNAQCGSTLKFTQWDKEKQYAPFVDKLNTDAALMVVQENVLGTGKVIFTQNTNSFTSWYENLDHGDAVLSFMLGMPVKEHSEKVMQMNGGIGMVVKE